MVYATLKQRAITFIIDLFFLHVVFSIGVFLCFPASETRVSLGTQNGWDDVIGIIGTWLCFLGTWLYFSLSQSSSWQATLGQRLLDIKVTNMDGNRIGFIQASIRFYAMLAFGVAILVGLSDDKKQAFYDMLAKTLVVRK